MFITCEFISTSKIDIPENAQFVGLSPQRTPMPTTGSDLSKEDKGAAMQDKVVGAPAVSPVQLSVYDKEMLNLLGSCRAYLLGEELSTGRRRKMMKRLTKGMVWEKGSLWKETEVGHLRVLQDVV